MTHEQFMGLKPDSPYKLTDEQRRRIEKTRLWKWQQDDEAMRKAMRQLREDLLASGLGTFLRWCCVALDRGLRRVGRCA